MRVAHWRTKDVLYYVLALTICLGCVNVALAETQDATAITCLKIIDLSAFEEDWEASMKITEEILDQAIKDVGEKTGVPLAMSALEQESITPDGIKEAIKKLDYNNMSTLIIYYHGHGATDNIKGHYLELKQKQALLRSEILDACLVRRQPPKLLILITDCCSVKLPIALAPAPAPIDRVEIIKNLFLRHSGVIDITAATYDPVKHKGEDAYLIGNGAFFTQSFSQAYFDLNVQSFDFDRDGFVSWPEFLVPVQRNLASRVDSLRQNNPNAVSTQTLQTFSLGKSDRNAALRLRRDTGLVLKERDGSLVVDSVRSNSPATRIVELNGKTVPGAQFIKDDRITHVNGRSVNSIAGFEAAINEAPSKSFIRIQGFDANMQTFAPYSAFIQLER